VFLSNGAVVPSQVDTLADRTPIFADASYYATSSLELLGTYAAYSALYKSQVWVGIVIRKLAMGTARMPFNVQIRLNDTDSKPENGPLTELLARPNPRMSGFKLWEWTSSTRDIYGEAFWLKLRDEKNVVRELHPMHPANVIARRNIEGGLEYIYSSGTRNVSMLPPIPEDDVVAFTTYNPDNLTRGLSNLEGLRMTLLNEDAARRATQAFWKNGLRPSMIVTHPGELSQPAKDRLKANVDARHAGADNMGGSIVLDEGMTMVEMQLTAEEMQYIEGRKLNREEVCGAYDVPPPVVHILDHATFSNITEQLRSQYRDTMAPRFVGFESVVNHQLVPDFYPDRGVYSRFNMDEVLRGDFEAKAEAAVSLRNAGLLTGNQGIAMFDLPRSEDPNMDRYFANAALVPLGTPAQRISITEAATPTPAMAAEAAVAAGGADVAAADAAAGKAVTRSFTSRVNRKATTPVIRAAIIATNKAELDKFFAKQRASVKAAVGKKAAGVFDPAAWDGDLSTILHSLSEATAKTIGAKVAADLGGEYDGAEIADYLKSNSVSTAKSINATTADQIATALEDAANDEDAIDGLFDGEIAARSNQISLTRLAVIGGLAAQVAARLSKAKTKTWITTSAKPRPSHAAMDGETVELNTPFSNGGNGPGDYSMGADEVAGCTCDLDFSMEG
jgi:HK97 family phage portal protein